MLRLYPRFGLQQEVLIWSCIHLDVQQNAGHRIAFFIFFFFFECDQENNVPLCTVICLPLSPFLSPSFIFPFHPSLNPIRLGTWAAELCLHRLQLDTHTHRQTIICIHACTHMTTHTLSTLHTLPPINFLLSFVWIKTLKSAYKRWPWDTED